MKKSLYLKIIIIILFFGIWINHAEAHVTIKMTDDGFVPAQLEIQVGETVVFENVGKNDHWPASNIHPTHSIYPEFDPKKGIHPGEKWEFTFTKPGIWRSHDHLYPKITGAITVKGEAETPATTPEVTKIQQKSFIQKIWDFIVGLFSHKAEEKNVASIAKDSQAIFADNASLKKYIQEYGPKATIQQLNVLSSRYGSCHNQAHVAGRISYELMGDKAFKECGAECHSGCYHGATEAYFKEHGTANLSQNLNTLCGSELNGFFSHQCVHGIGHGLMAWTDYDIFEALKSCDLLDKRQDSCWTGVFMENIVGGLTDKNDTTGHFTKYLSNDPQYPCTIVDEKYKSSCYFLQTSRMVQLVGGDFSKVAAECLKVPAVYQYVCFSSMGRDVGGVNIKNPAGSIKACSYAPVGTLRTACLLGAAQDSFWDPAAQDDGIAFCKLITDDSEKNACYTTIVARARELINLPKEFKTFCSKVEPEYQTLCAQ